MPLTFAVFGYVSLTGHKERQHSQRGLPATPLRWKANDQDESQHCFAGGGHRRPGVWKFRGMPSNAGKQIVTFQRCQAATFS